MCEGRAEQSKAGESGAGQKKGQGSIAQGKAGESRAEQKKGQGIDNISRAESSPHNVGGGDAAPAVLDTAGG